MKPSNIILLYVDIWYVYIDLYVYIYIHTYTMYTHLIPKNKTNQIIKQVGQLWGITVQGCHWWPIMTWADYLSTCWRAIIWGSVNSWFFHGLQNSTWDAINLDIIFDTVKKMPEFAVSMMCFYGKSTIGGTIYRSLVFHFLRPSSAKPRILYIGLLEMSGPNIAIGYFFQDKSLWFNIKTGHKNDSNHLSGFG